MKETLERALVAVPLTAIVQFVTQWTDLVRVPLLTHPDWQATASDVARPFSIAVVLAILILLGERSKLALRRWALVFIVLWLILMLGCLGFYMELGSFPDRKDEMALLAIWHVFFEVALIAAAASALTVGLWLEA
jgi:hypothetical protein